ncbi:MAG: hypothetical protein ABJK25_06845 [Halieaceae bacterium]
MRIETIALFVNYAFLTALLLLTALAYYFGLPGAFLFDDLTNLTLNPYLNFDVSKLDAWRTASFSSDAGLLRRPISMFTFALNFAVADGLYPAQVKAVNVGLHLINGILLYFLAVEIQLAAYQKDISDGAVKAVAVVATGIWLLHPLHISTVMYSVQRMAQLSTLFVLVGLLVYFRYRARWSVAGYKTLGELSAALLWLSILFMLAILSKENGALLPWLIAVSELCLFRGRWSGRPSRLVQRIGVVAFTAPIVFLLFILFFSPDYILPGYDNRDFTISERLFTQSRLLWTYLYWLVFPDIRSFGLHHDDIAISRSLVDPMSTLAAICAWVVCLFLVFKYRKRYRLIWYALLFYLVAHSMESGVIALEMVYEHRNYLPSIALVIPAAAILVTTGRFIGGRLKYVPAAIVIVTFFCLLAVRAVTWSDELILGQASVKQHPQSPRSHFFYAVALQNEYFRKVANGTLGDLEGEALAGSMRSHLISMYKLDKADIAALVMLQQIEARYFPGYKGAYDWLEELERIVGKRALASSDYAALSVLVDCAIAGTCGETAKTDLRQILGNLIDKYPNDRKLLLAQYKYLAGIGDRAARSAVLSKLARLYPQWPVIHYHMIQENMLSNNVGGMYDNVSAWLATDARRQQVHLLEGLFINAEQSR